MNFPSDLSLFSQLASFGPGWLLSSTPYVHGGLSLFSDCERQAVERGYMTAHLSQKCCSVPQFFSAFAAKKQSDTVEVNGMACSSLALERFTIPKKKRKVRKKGKEEEHEK